MLNGYIAWKIIFCDPKGNGNPKQVIWHFHNQKYPDLITVFSGI